MQGETCNPNPPRSGCPTALAELARLHWSILNCESHPDVVAGWTAQGCRPEVERRLGYRLRDDPRYAIRLANHGAWREA